MCCHHGSNIHSLCLFDEHPHQVSGAQGQLPPLPPYPPLNYATEPGRNGPVAANPQTKPNDLDNMTRR